MTIGTGACCVQCQTYLATRKTGAVVLETYEDGRPYKVWHADLLECPDCGFQIIKGFAMQPCAVSHEPDFEKELQRVEITINGCPKRL